LSEQLIFEQRKYAWDYFTLHATQRLTTFNFYLVLAALLITGAFTAFKIDFLHPIVGAGLGLVLAFLSFVFHKLDERNRELVGIGEQALMFLEKEISSGLGSDQEPHVLQLFLKEKFQTDNLKKQRFCHILKKHLSYSDCFRCVFIMFGGSGLVIAAYALFHSLFC